MKQVFSVCNVFVILHEEYLLPHVQAQRKCKPVVSLVLSFPCKDFAIFIEKKSSSGHACSTTVPATAILSSTDQQVQNSPPPPPRLFSASLFLQTAMTILIRLTAGLPVIMVLLTMTMFHSLGPPEIAQQLKRLTGTYTINTTTFAPTAVLKRESCCFL